MKGFVWPWIKLGSNPCFSSLMSEFFWGGKFVILLNLFFSSSEMGIVIGLSRRDICEGPTSQELKMGIIFIIVISYSRYETAVNN